MHFVRFAGLMQLCPFNLFYRGIIEGPDDYVHLSDIMADVRTAMNKKSGGLWDEFVFEFVGGGKNPTSYYILSSVLRRPDVDIINSRIWWSLWSPRSELQLL